MTLLEAKNIKKYFSPSVRAVDQVTLRVTQGINLGLVGESGCGKTTLSRILMKLITCDQGSIIYEGKDITRFKFNQLMDFRKSVQMVFQDPYNSLDPRFTIRRILNEAMILNQKIYKSEDERLEHLKGFLASVSLNKDILNRYPHEFSGGERQRIALARALIVSPKLIILDEAVSSLDVIIQNEILTLLKDLQKKFNVTYLFVSHNLKVVRKICQVIAVMYKGKIIEMASKDEIFNNPIHPYTKQLLSAAIHYKVSSSQADFEIKQNAQWIDRGKGHWVLTND